MVINKKNKAINLRTIFFYILFLLSLQGLPQQFKKGLFSLKEYKIIDSSFYNELLSAVLADSSCFKNRDSYVLNLIFDSSYSSKYDFILLSVPINKKDSFNNHGFFRIGRKICFINKSFPLYKLKTLFFLSVKKKKFFYQEMVPNDKYGTLITDYPEEFSTWFLKYSNGRLFLIKKYCI